MNAREIVNRKCSSYCWRSGTFTAIAILDEVERRTIKKINAGHISTDLNGAMGESVAEIRAELEGK